MFGWIAALGTAEGAPTALSYGWVPGDRAVVQIQRLRSDVDLPQQWTEHWIVGADGSLVRDDATFRVDDAGAWVESQGFSTLPVGEEDWPYGGFPAKLRPGRTLTDRVVVENPLHNSPILATATWRLGEGVGRFKTVIRDVQLDSALLWAPYAEQASLNDTGAGVEAVGIGRDTFVVDGQLRPQQVTRHLEARVALVGVGVPEVLRAVTLDETQVWTWTLNQP